MWLRNGGVIHVFPLLLPMSVPLFQQKTISLREIVSYIATILVSLPVPLKSPPSHFSLIVSSRFTCIQTFSPFLLVHYSVTHFCCTSVMNELYSVNVNVLDPCLTPEACFENGQTRTSIQSYSGKKRREGGNV